MTSYAFGRFGTAGLPTGDRELGGGVELMGDAVVQPAFGQGHPPGRPEAATRSTDHLGRERLVLVQRGEVRVELAQGGHQTEPLAGLATHGEALEVPGDV